MKPPRSLEVGPSEAALGFATFAGGSADVFDNPGAGFGGGRALFADFVTQARDRAKAKNHDVTVIAGISTGPSGIETEARLPPLDFGVVQVVGSRGKETWPCAP